ncbi:hypothetical protein GCM10008927_09030 [Amylibacter ulvae]|uniref:Uncharacterized protein n=1 Tax=Paramylibacter ulvae TaxID=1651968 RepID=A0ABQ3CXL5_9RHOB|nr:Lin0512 family protein [Amylibacter ulvae]GHA46053.1 hypothetical protein GCM10008927_09030 [Amylibacter ulvae]
MKRLILEMGMGADLYGLDYTKAANRAVQDALRHSSLILFRSLDLDTDKMEVRVTIGVQDPDKVDTDAVAATLPRGQASVHAELGGQNVIDSENGTEHAIAIAAIEAYYPIIPDEWRLSTPQQD